MRLERHIDQMPLRPPAHNDADQRQSDPAQMRFSADLAGQNEDLARVKCGCLGRPVGVLDAARHLIYGAFAVSDPKLVPKLDPGPDPNPGRRPGHRPSRRSGKLKLTTGHCLTNLQV